MEERKETFNEFARSLKYKDKPRKFRITGSVGIRQAFLFLQKRKWKEVGRPITESQFQHIVRDVNELLAFELVQNRSIILPHSMGEIEVRKYTRELKFENGKLVSKLPIDWDATLKLWYEDDEAYKNRTVVRFPRLEAYKVLYNRSSADYENKSYYQFTLNRTIYRLLGQQLSLGKLEGFAL